MSTREGCCRGPRSSAGGSPTSGSPGSKGAPPAKKALLFGVPRVVVLLGVVSLLNDLAGEMVTPLLPLFLIGPLLAPVAVVGLVEGAADSLTALLKVGVGHRSDVRGRRKPYILLGYGAGALAKPLLAISVVWPQAVGARLLDRAGKGVRGAPRDAAIAEATPSELLGRSFGFHRAFDTAGAVGGAFLALGILLLFETSTQVPFKLVFLAASIPAAVSVALLAFGLKERAKDRQEGTGGSPPRPKLLRALRTLPRPVKSFLAVSALFALGNFTIGLFVLRVNEFAGRAALVLVAYILFNMCATLLSIPAGNLADRHGRRTLVAVAMALFVAASLAFALVNSYIEAIAAFVVYGVFFAFWESSHRAYLSEICPKDLRGTALGAHGTVIGLLTLPGSLVASLIWQFFEPRWAFLYGALLGAAALAVFVAVREKPAAPLAN